MNTTGTRVRWLSAIVLAHLVISLVHGLAHARAHVPMSRAANLFVFVVILAGPVAGLALAGLARRAGSLVVGATMASALVFGLINHFVFPSVDHVAHVDPEWRPLFAATAALLALTEGLGSGVAIRLAFGRQWS